jgi:hypothetical protein
MATTVKATVAMVSVVLRYPTATVTVRLQPDGTAAVDLYAFLVGRKDVSGTVKFDRDGNVTRNNVEDSFDTPPLTPYVLQLAAKRALEALREARRHLAVVAGTHTRKETSRAI